MIGRSPFLQVMSVQAFTPLDLAGLVGWYEANGTLWQDSARTTAVTTNNDPVGAWDDSSGNGNHLTQATSSKRMTYKTSILNSLPSVRGDAVDDFMGKSSLVVASPMNIIFVIGLKAGYPKGICSTNGYTEPMLFKHTGGTPYTLTSGGTQIHSLPSDAGSFILRVSYDSDWSVWQNNDSPTVTTVSGAKAGVNFYINAIYGGTGGEAFLADHDFHEIILHDGNLTAGEWTDLKAYLNAKWAVY